MINFLRIDEHLVKLKEYFKKSTISFCDICVGTRYLWRKKFVAYFAEYKNTLILKETANGYSNAFYYPIGENVQEALEQIEAFCVENNLPLLFCCIDNDTALKLAERYLDVEIYNDRAWSDYIYSTEELITLRGKKFSGQRNHINKFKSVYSDYQVVDLLDVTRAELDSFFVEYVEEKGEKNIGLEKEELLSVEQYVEKLKELDQVGIAIKVDGRVIGITAGEILSDTLIVHVEKALKKYNGVYPTLANEFNKRYAVGLSKINREEDCGDMGLRISKLQYHPIEIKQKNFVLVKTLFDKISSPIIKTERLTITEILERDKKDYFRLYIDEDLNKFWGYDYKTDCKEASEEYFFNFQNSLKEKKEEFSFAVRKGDKFIGELVLYNFTFKGEVEIGFRFFREFQKKGYAFESASALMEYTKNVLGAKVIKCRCFKQNVESQNLIKKLGFNKDYETQEKYFFVKKLK